MIEINMKPIRTLEQSRNIDIFNWMVVYDLFCRRKEELCKRKKSVSLNSTCHDLDASFL